LARAIAREKELATRSALGGTRGRIARQLLLESLLLAALGGLLGTVLAFSVVATAGSLLAGSVPRAGEIAVDAYVLGIGVALSLATGLMFGLAPAFAASRLALSGALKAGAQTASHGARAANTFVALIVAEMALATVLLASAGLFIQSFLKLDRLDAGFDPTNVLTFELDWPAREHPDPAAAFGRLRDRLLQTPGVVAASTDVQLPYRGEALLDDTAPFAQIEGRPLPAGERPRVRLKRIQPGFLRALRIPLVGGRDFSDDDRAGTPPVAIVNRSFARAYLGSDDEPIGNRLRLDSWTLLGDEAAEIVGIAEDVRHDGLRAEVEPVVYLPFAQRPVWGATMIVKTRGNPLAYVGAVREAVRTIDSDQPIDNIGTLEQRLAASLAADRFRALLLGSFSVMAVSLAAVGLFAVLSYTTARRMREIGIRMALGARAADVAKAVVGQGMRPVVGGMLIGMVGAAGVFRLIDNLLFEVAATDATAFGLAIAVLLSVAAFACAVPARRAARADAVAILKSE
jgi:putative ABC transport system permease protein